MSLIDLEAAIETIRFDADRVPDDLSGNLAAAYRNGMFAAIDSITRRPTVEAVVLPCKPGTTVYEIHNNTDACLDCDHWLLAHRDEEECGHPEHKTEYPSLADSPVCEKHFMEVIDYTATEERLFKNREKFGKLIFLTREDAEAALAKMKGLEVGA